LHCVPKHHDDPLTDQILSTNQNPTLDTNSKNLRNSTLRPLNLYSLQIDRIEESNLALPDFLATLIF